MALHATKTIAYALYELAELVDAMHADKASANINRLAESLTAAKVETAHRLMVEMAKPN